MNANFLSNFAEAAEGKPVEFLRTGKFKDMNGKEVEITSETLDQIVASFAAGEAGQDVPVDIMHKREESAGWIKSVWRKGNKLLAQVDWNSLGQGLVKDKIYRYLSATINLASKVLVSISLVNFPAVKGLASVELSAEQPDEIVLLIAPDESLQDYVDEIRQAWYALNINSLESPGWICDVTPTFVIIDKNGSYYQVNYTDSPEKGIQFDVANATRVRQAWVPDDTAGLSSPISEEKTMSEVKDQKATEGKPLVVETPAQQPDTKIDLSAVLAKARADLEAQYAQELATFKEGMLAEQKAWVAERTKVVGEMMAQLREEQELLRFAETVTSTGKYALPIRPDEVISLMTDIGPDARQALRTLLEKIHQGGTVNFAEVGTSAGDKSIDKKPLDPVIKGMLNAFLAEGGKVEEFFAMNADVLGGMEHWEL